MQPEELWKGKKADEGNNSKHAEGAKSVRPCELTPSTKLLQTSLRFGCENVETWISLLGGGGGQFFSQLNGWLDSTLK